MNLLHYAIILLTIGILALPILSWASWAFQKANHDWAQASLVWIWIVTFPLAFLFIFIYAAQIGIPVGLPIGRQFTVEKGWHCSKENPKLFCDLPFK